jgi:hypothetical protein
MPRFGLEPMIPASARGKTVHALDRSATVTGNYNIMSTNKHCTNLSAYMDHILRYGYGLD